MRSCPLRSRLTLALTAMLLVLAAHPSAGLAACANPVACENEKPGTAPGAWQVDRRRRLDDPGLCDGDERQQAAAPIRFKVKTTASAYHIDIFRLGYYQGNGARLQAGRRPPDRDACRRTQPACQTDAVDRADRLRQLGRVGVVDGAGRRRSPASTSRTSCATTPAARARSRSWCATTRATSDILVRTSDTTWQAYNKLRRQQPLLVHRRVPAGQPAGVQGRVQGLLQPPVRRHAPAGRRALVPVLRRVPDDPVPRAQRLRRQLHRARPTSTPTRALLRNHKAVHLERPRRVLVGPRARERRGRARRRREPRVLQRQRGVLEDALGVEQRRRHGDAVPDAGDLQGHALRRARPTRWRGPAPGATRASARRGRRPARERADRAALHRQLRAPSDITVPAAVQEPAAVAEHRRWRTSAPGRRARSAPGEQTLGFEWDIDADNGFRPRGSFELSSTTVTGVESFTDYGTHRRRRHRPQTHHLTLYRRAERRAGVRRGHRAVGVGPRHHERVEQHRAGQRRRARSGHAAGDRQPVRRHGRAGDDADEPGCVAASHVDRHDGAQLDDHQPGRGRRDRRRDDGHGHGHRDRRRRRRGGGRRGLDRRRRRRGIRPPARRRGPTAGTPTARRRTTIKSRAVDDSGNLETALAERRRVNVGCPCTIWGPNVTPEIVDQEDTSSVEVGVQLQVRPRRDDHRRPLLQVGGEHRHARRQPVDGDGTLLATGTFGGETRDGLAAAELHDAGRRHGGHHLRGVVLRPARALLDPRRATSSCRVRPAATRSTARRCMRSAPTAAAPMGSTPMRATRRSRPPPTTARTTRVDVVFTPKLPPGPTGTVDGDARPRLRDRELQRPGHRRPARRATS